MLIILCAVVNEMAIMQVGTQLRREFLAQDLGCLAG